MAPQTRTICCALFNVVAFKPFQAVRSVLSSAVGKKIETTLHSLQPKLKMLLAVPLALLTVGIDNGKGLTPPMGWRDWYVERVVR